MNGWLWKYLSVWKLVLHQFFKSAGLCHKNYQNLALIMLLKPEWLDVFPIDFLAWWKMMEDAQS